jgi:hypothetical protein
MPIRCSSPEMARKAAALLERDWPADRCQGMLVELEACGNWTADQNQRSKLLSELLRILAREGVMDLVDTVARHVEYAQKGQRTDSGEFHHGFREEISGEATQIHLTACERRLGPYRGLLNGKNGYKLRGLPEEPPEDISIRSIPEAIAVTFNGLSPQVRRWQETVLANWFARNSDHPSVQDFTRSIPLFLDYVWDVSGDIGYMERAHDGKGSMPKKGPKARELYLLARELFTEDMIRKQPAWARRCRILFAPSSFAHDEFFPPGGEEGESPPFTEVIDYLESLGEGGHRIDRISLEQAVAGTVALMRTGPLATKGTGDTEGVDFVELRRFGNGFRFVRLLTPRVLDRETAALGHCVGKGSYDRRLRTGSSSILSLRDPQGVPVATLEITAEEGEAPVARQAKSKDNGPVDPEHAPMLLAFLVDAGIVLVGDRDKLGLPAVRPDRSLLLGAPGKGRAEQETDDDEEPELPGHVP